MGVIVTEAVSPARKHLKIGVAMGMASCYPMLLYMRWRIEIECRDGFVRGVLVNEEAFNMGATHHDK
jgi:hypothetical protein